MIKNLVSFFVFIYFSFFLSILNAEIVKKIEISGNSRISDETVKVYGDIKGLNLNYSRNDLDNILKNLYSTNFFENVNLEIRNEILYINLDEYPVINQLVIIGEKSNKFKNEIKKIIFTKENGSFIENKLNNDINAIKNFYASLGYNFAEINAEIKKVDSKNIDLAFKIDRGKVTKISKISFTGDKKVKDKRLRDIIASEEDKFWKVISKNTRFSENMLNLDKRLLINYYRSIGYYDVLVNSTSAELASDNKISINYNIDAGIRYSIDKISTNVDAVFDKKIFFSLNKSYNKLIGEYYSPFKIKEILEEIDEIIDDNNLQFVEHRVRENISADKISIVFDIFEGEKITVERINILGNNVTEEAVIRSELIVDEGDPFTDIKLDKSIANIKARNIFKTVESKIISGSSSDLKVIEISVEEQPTGEVSAGAGVGTEGGTFAFNVTENNWLGQGKEVGAEFEINSESVRGSLKYTNPNYDLLGNSLNYQLSSISNDRPNQGYENRIISAGIGTGFEQYKDFFTYLNLYASHDDLRTSSSASSSLKKQKGKFSELAGDYTLVVDNRNRKFAPTSGSIVSFGQTIPFYADKPYISNTFSSSTYQSFGENLVGSGKIFFEAINGLNNEDVRLSKRKILNSKRLRGFERGKIGPMDGKDHIGGNYAAALNLDAQLPNVLPDASNADVALFLDFGNVWGVDYDETLDESNKLRSSTGVNINWLSPVGPVSFTFATDLAKADTDKTQSFSFNLGTQF